MENRKNLTIWNKDFICVILANMLLCLGHFAVNPYVASYSKLLGAGTRLTGFLTGMFFGVALAMRPISGPMITKLDKRILLIGVFVLGAVAQLGYALFPTIPMFIVFRFVNGAQYSFVGSLIMTMAGDSLPPDKMISGLGIFGIGGSIGMSLAPEIGTRILNFGRERFGELGSYRLLFLYAMTMMLIAIIPSLLRSPDKRSKEDSASVGKWYKNIITVHAIPISVVMIFLIASNSLYNAYIIEFAKERGIANASVFFSIMALTLLLVRPLMGLLADRVGISKILFPAIVIFSLSFLVVSISTTLPMLLLGAFLAALGYGATQPTIQAMCMRVVPPLKRGVASNTLYVGMDLGFFLGPLFGAFAIEATGSYGGMFKTAVIPAFIALIVLIAILPRLQRQIEKVSNS